LLDANPGTSVEMIRTGIDLPSSPPSPPVGDGVLRIGHFGELGAWVKRDPIPVMRAAARLMDDGRVPAGGVHFEFYGSVDDGFRERLASSGLERLVTLHGAVDRDVALTAMRASDVALLLMWPGDVQSVPMKAVEYLRAGKRMIVTGAGAEAETRRVLGGIEGVCLCDDDAAIEAAILECARLRAAGETLDRPEDAVSEEFTQRGMALRFETVAKRVAAAHKG
jgi:hypothetical protein